MSKYSPRSGSDSVFSDSTLRQEASAELFFQVRLAAGERFTVMKIFLTSGFIPSNLPSMGMFCLLCAFLLPMLQGCGSGLASEAVESRVLEEVQQTYGMTYDVPLYCGGTTATQSLDVVLEAARRLSAFCEQQNIESAKAGYLRCPTGLCQQEYAPGSRPAPTMKFSINNGNSISSMYGGFGGGMGSGGSGTVGGIGAVFGSRLYVTLEFNLTLARTPDVLGCVNPLNASVQTTILNEISKAAIAAKPGLCVPL